MYLIQDHLNTGVVQNHQQQLYMFQVSRDFLIKENTLQDTGIGQGLVQGQHLDRRPN